MTQDKQQDRKPTTTDEVLEHVVQGKPIWIMVEPTSVLGMALVSLNDLLSHKLLRFPTDIDIRCFEKHMKAKAEKAQLKNRQV